MRITVNLFWACLVLVISATAWTGCGEDSGDDSVISDESGDLVGNEGTANGDEGTGNTDMTVGEAGVVTHSSGVEIAVPAGALTEDVTLSIKAVNNPDSVLPATAANQGFASQAYEFLPHGQTFAESVDVVIPITSSLRSFDGVMVVRLDDLSDTTWEVVEGAVISSESASFSLDGFSVYAVVATEAETNSASNGTTTPDNPTEPEEEPQEEPEEEPEEEPSSEPSSMPGG